jgi:hypothetical protein
MLYKINHNTWLDLPKWKCRPEFAALWLALNTPKQDIDLIAKLRAECDRLTALHRAGKRAPLPNQISSNSRPVTAYDAQGRLLGTYPNSRLAAVALFGIANNATVSGINQVRCGRVQTYKGYHFENEKKK